MRKHSIKTIIIALLVLGITSGGLVGITGRISAQNQVTNSQYITQTARKADIAVNVTSTGTVFASVTKDIAANNSGEIKDLSVKEGDTVKAGQKLFTADSDQIRQQVGNADLNLQKQNLQLKKMKTQDDIDLQNLSIKDAKNNLNNAKQQLNNMTVQSPIDGIVTAKNNNNGDTVQSGKTVLSVTDTKSLKVRASVDELDISKIKIGQTAQVKFNAIDGKTFDGSIESISSVGTTTNNVTTYSVVINLNDNTGVMLGMNANVNIIVESKKDALAVSSEALVDRNGKTFVMVPSENSDGSTSQEDTANQKKSSQSAAGKNGNYNAGSRTNSSQGATGMQGKLIEVKTGIQNEKLVEITEGISEGQKVMISLPQVNSNTTNAKTTTGNKGSNGFGAGMGSGMFGGGAGRAASGR